ncbi:MAG: hypothetical protein KAJ19_18030 [Gammaproteobacteria bacterium]|nr:hypothetical protein [Gammaproteobacteria bacterium]
MSSFKDSISRVMEELEKEIDDIAGIIVAEFSKEASLDIGEQWAWKVIDLLLDDRMRDLKPQTIVNRTKRGISITGDRKVLIETGKLLSSVKVIYKHLPGKADLLELGIEEDATHTAHGTTSAISTKKLAVLHEYGFTAKGTSVPARPVFKQAALEIGYEADRIISNDWNYFIRGRTIQKYIKGDDIVSSSARAGATSTYNTDVGFTAIGRIKRNGTSAEFYFEWDSAGKKYMRGKK